MMKKYLKIWRYLLIAIFILLAIFILDKFLALRGVLELRYDFSKEPTLISEITPQGRASDRLKNLTTKETYQSLSGDPTYFSVESPRSFDQAEVTLTYRNPVQNIVELGLRKSIDWQFELKPIENKFIDQSDWTRLEKENIILLQKNKNFESVDDFLNNLPLETRIAVYNYQLPYSFKLDDYQASSSGLEINNTLRGSHEFYTYLKDEDLDFTFQYQDLNWGFDRDDFQVKVYSGTTEIHSDYDADDGIEIASGEKGEIKEKRVLLTDLPEGAYRVVLPVTDDIIIHQIKTQQHLLVAKDKLFLVDNEAYQLEEAASQVYTNSDQFLFKTDHPSGLQNIKIKDEELEINELGKYVEWTDDEGFNDLKSLFVPRNDLLIKSSGFYAFAPENFFDPDYYINTLKSGADIEAYDYLIAADYIKPQDYTQRWQIATQQFDLNYVPGDRKTLDFLISAPQLDKINDDILIKEIKIKLTRQPLLSRLYEKFK